MKIKEFLQKKWWAVPAIVNLVLLSLSAVLLGIFLILNWKCILNPELSHGYSFGTPFGDGGDIFRVGFFISHAIIFWLTIFDLVQIIIIPLNNWAAQKTVLYVFSGIVVIELTCLGNISSLLSLFVWLLPLMAFDSLTKPIIIPLAIIILSAILAFMKKRIALPLCLFALTATASFSLEIFACYLYLD